MPPEIGSSGDWCWRLGSNMFRSRKQNTIARKRRVSGLVLLHGRLDDVGVNPQRTSRWPRKGEAVRRVHVDGGCSRGAAVVRRRGVLLRTLRDTSEERNGHRRVGVAVGALPAVLLGLRRRILRCTSSCWRRNRRELRVDEAAPLAIWA